MPHKKDARGDATVWAVLGAESHASGFGFYIPHKQMLRGDV
jgi:hypothetical protein